MVKVSYQILKLVIFGCSDKRRAAANFVCGSFLLIPVLEQVQHFDVNFTIVSYNGLIFQK